MDSGQGEEEHFQQMEEAHLEEAGMQISAELDEWEVTARECIDMALKQNGIETRARWSEWVNSALEGAQEEPMRSREHLSLTLCSISKVFKMPRKLQARPCSLQRRRNFRNCGYRGSRTLPTKPRFLREPVCLYLRLTPSVVLHASFPRTPPRPLMVLR